VPLFFLTMNLCKILERCGVQRDAVTGRCSFMKQSFEDLALTICASAQHGSGTRGPVALSGIGVLKQMGLRN
jgi:hypothetical protein